MQGFGGCPAPLLLMALWGSACSRLRLLQAPGTANAQEYDAEHESDQEQTGPYSEYRTDKAAGVGQRIRAIDEDRQGARATGQHEGEQCDADPELPLRRAAYAQSRQDAVSLGRPWRFAGWVPDLLLRRRGWRRWHGRRKRTLRQPSLGPWLLSLNTACTALWGQG